MSNTAPNTSYRVATIASVLGPIISAVVAYAGATAPSLIVGFFILSALAYLGWWLFKEGFNEVAFLNLIACLIVCCSIGFSIYSSYYPAGSHAGPPLSECERNFEEGMKLYNQGLQSANHEKLIDALRKFQDALASKSDFIKAWIYSGRCYLKLKNFEQAQAALQKAYAVVPAEVKDDLIALYVDWVNVLCQQGKSQQALAKVSFLRNLDAALYARLLNSIGQC